MNLSRHNKGKFIGLICVGTFMLTLFGLVLSTSDEHTSRDLLAEFEDCQSSQSDPISYQSCDSSDSLPQEQGQLQLFVNSPDHPVICVEVSPSALVSDLKAAIAAQGIRVGKLSFGGEAMADHCPLGDVGLSAEATIQNEYDPISFIVHLYGQNDTQRIQCDAIMDDNLTKAEIMLKLRQCIHGAFEQFDPEDEEHSFMQIQAILAEDGSSMIVEEIIASVSGDVFDYARQGTDSVIIRERNGGFNRCLSFDCPDMLRSLFSGNLTIHDLNRCRPGKETD